MLKNLLKYDIKAGIKIHGIIYLCIIFVAFARLLLDYASLNYITVFFTPIVTFIGIALGMGVIVVTFIYNILYFRRNILKDEGYLMNTLPVNPQQLILSKWLSSFLFYVLDAITCFLGMTIVYKGFSWLDNFKLTFSNGITGVDSLDDKINSMIIILMFIFVITIVFYIISCFTAMTMGYSTLNHKDLMSFVFYIAIYVAYQILSIISIVIIRLLTHGNITDLFSAEIGLEFLNNILISQAILLVLISIALYFISVYFMKNKLNLE